MRSSRVIWVFLDGIGLGSRDDPANPLAHGDYPALASLAGGQKWIREARPFQDGDHVFHPIDATLGMPGLPQSGTGQASLFTGVNCAERAGRHWGPFPHSSSIPIIAEQSIFARLNRAKHSSQFLNAFPDRFFQSVAPRNRWTVTTRCCVEAGISVKTEADLRTGQALAADLTGEAWRLRLGLDVPIISPGQAGERLIELSDQADFTLFEYYLTDKAGHSRDHRRAEAVLEDLEAFFCAIRRHMDPASTLLVITSDHGNLEDLSVRVHTRNPVPLIAYGRGADAFAICKSIIDVTPAILDVLGNEE